MKNNSPYFRFRRLATRLAQVLAVMAACSPALAQEEASVAAVVNHESITTVDLRNRTNLVLFASGLPRTPEVAQRLQPQVLRTMIDEALQLQAAEANNIKVSDREVEAILANMARENRLAADGLQQFLADKGIEKSALERQIRASLSWSKLIERRFASQALVGEDEIDDELARIADNQGQPRILVSEIFLAVEDPAQDAQVRQSAQRIMQQLRNGAGFDALARAFSQNTAAASGGDLGWLVLEQIDPAIRKELSAMQPGQLAGPIRALDGYHIVALRDRRLPGGSSPNQVTVDLRQINLPVSQQATEAELRAAVEASEQIRASVDSCSSLGAGSLPGGARVANIGRVRIGDLAAPLQAPLMGLEPNQISQPMRGPGGIMLLMVCGREAESAGLPSREQIKERLFREKLDLLARRYLRDLRRAAFLDVRV